MAQNSIIFPYKKKVRLETTIQHERVIPKFPGQNYENLSDSSTSHISSGFLARILLYDLQNGRHETPVHSEPTVRHCKGEWPWETSTFYFHDCIFKAASRWVSGLQNSPITGNPHNGDFLHIYLWSWKFSSCWHPDIEVSRTQQHVGVSENRVFYPPNHPFVHRVFHYYKPSILGGCAHPYFWFNIQMHLPLFHQHFSLRSPVSSRSLAKLKDQKDQIQTSNPASARKNHLSVANL